MGTRADFYVGRGRETATWLGSIAYDGRWPETFRGCTTEDDFRARVAKWLEGRDDATYPVDGWPWPWEDSCLTDVSYAFDGIVWMTDRGGKNAPICDQCSVRQQIHQNVWVDLHEQLASDDAWSKHCESVRKQREKYFAKHRPTTPLHELEQIIAEKFPYGPEPKDATPQGYALFPKYGGAAANVTLGSRSGVMFIKP